MRSLILAGLLLPALAQAQQLSAPQSFGPAPLGGVGSDAAPAQMMVDTAAEGGLKRWYAQQKRPPVVIYFDRQLDKLPAGWRGASRLLIEDSTRSASKDETRQITVGVQHNTETDSSSLSDFAKVFEQSLQKEMQRQQFRMLDSAVLHRKESARGGAPDIEYESLRKAARFVLEVQLLAISGELELVGVLKDIHTGDVPASVRVPVDSKLDSVYEIDRISRSLVHRLLREPVNG
jgi:hypothetical protein